MLPTSLFQHFQSDQTTDIVRININAVPGAFVLRNALSSTECENLYQNVIEVHEKNSKKRSSNSKDTVLRREFCFLET